MNVPVIVAPYEADAQITYLVKSGVADFAITEDSDLLPFGCQVINELIIRMCVRMVFPF